jgi:hypothetical protein
MLEYTRIYSNISLSSGCEGLQGKAGEAGGQAGGSGKWTGTHTTLDVGKRTIGEKRCALLSYGDLTCAQEEHFRSPYRKTKHILASLMLGNTREVRTVTML